MRKSHLIFAVSSLGPGSAAGEKAINGQIGKISASEASRAVAWGKGKGGHPFPSQDYLSARFARQFFFFRPRRLFSTFFPQCGAWSQAMLQGLAVGHKDLVNDCQQTKIWEKPHPLH